MEPAINIWTMKLAHWHLKVKEVKIMKCINCKTENIMKADYCKACGRQFTPQEKEAAYNKTLFGIIDKILDLKSYITLDFITGSNLFKAATLIVIILYSLIVLKINGNRIRILESPRYEVEYNKNTDKYFLVTEDEYVNLSLYIPEKTRQITVFTLDDNEEIISRQDYSPEDEITLAYQPNQHYAIADDKQQLELFVIITE